jgi:hypothetical protein
MSRAAEPSITKSVLKVGFFSGLLDRQGARPKVPPTGRATRRKPSGGFCVGFPQKGWSDHKMSWLERLLLHYGIYRRYPLKRWPAFKNACRIVFR